MWKRSASLRALVTERLTAAAEDIFALVERTMAEYEEELRRCREENQRKQQLLDLALRPQLLDAQVQTATPEMVPAPLRETVEIKVEPDLAFGQTLPECTAVSAKGEARRQSEHRKATQGEEPVTAVRLTADISQQMTDDNEGSRSDDRVALVQPPVCKKFPPVRRNQRHSKVQVGETPFSCSACTNGLMQKVFVRTHLQTRHGETPFSCPVCARRFKLEDHLRRHMSTHAAQNGLGFTRKNKLQSHKETGDRPFSCSECNARFRRRVNLNRHLTVHCKK